MTTANQRKLPRIVGGCELITRVGQGGMGTVFKARQVSLDRVVAIKLLPPSIAKKDPVFIERFLREARTSAKLNHPNIVQGIDVGKDEASGLYYFVMEFVDGPTVKTLLQQQKVLPEKQALEITRAVAQALHCAHKAGIIHRDIKPDNILLNLRNEPKLADLGLARFILDTSLDDVSSDNGHASGNAELTQAGMSLGTPAYMAPEQVQGKSELIDVRTDLYELGGTLFHMLTGHAPYVASSAQLVMQMHLDGPVPNVRAVNYTVSEETGRLVSKLMQKKPADRHQSAEQVEHQIDRILSGEHDAKVTGRRTAVTTGGLKPITRDLRKSERTVAEAGSGGRRSLHLFAGAVALLAVAAAVVLVLSNSKSTPQVVHNSPPPPPPTPQHAATAPAVPVPANPAPKSGTARPESESAPRVQPGASHARSTDEPLPDWPPLKKACEAAKQTPNEYARLIGLFQDAEKGAAPSLIPAIRHERGKVEREQIQAFRKVFDGLDAQARAKTAEREFGKALDLLRDQNFPPEVLGELTRPAIAGQRDETERRAFEDYLHGTEPALFAELNAAGDAPAKLKELAGKTVLLNRRYDTGNVAEELEVLRRTAEARTRKVCDNAARQQDAAFKKLFDAAYQAATGGNWKEAEDAFARAKTGPLAERHGEKLAQFAADLKAIRDYRARAAAALSRKIGSNAEITLHQRGVTLSGKLSGKGGEDSFQLEDGQGGSRPISVDKLDGFELIELAGVNSQGAEGRYAQGICDFWLSRAGRGKAADAWTDIKAEDTFEWKRAAFYLAWIREDCAGEIIERLRELYKQSRTQPDKKALQEEAYGLLTKLKTEFGTTEAYREVSQKK